MAKGCEIHNGQLVYYRVRDGRGGLVQAVVTRVSRGWLQVVSRFFFSERQETIPGFLGFYVSLRPSRIVAMDIPTMQPKPIVVDKANRSIKDMAAQELHQLRQAIQAELSEREGDPALIEQARELYADGSDNDIEIDSDAVISRGDDGAWVQAWVFVRDEGE